LKKLCIKGCPVSDDGIESLVSGCPKLVKVKVKKCRGVTWEGADRLRANRGSLAVNLDTPLPNPVVGTPSGAGAAEASAPSTSKSSIAKAKFSLFAGRNLVACAFLRLSNGSDGDHKRVSANA